MARTFTIAQDYSKDPRPSIALSPVKSNQVKEVGYDPATKTLAVTFTRGAGAIYHYPGVTPEAYAEFIGAESIGKHFGQHIQSLPFSKYAPDPVVHANGAPMYSTTTFKETGDPLMLDENGKRSVFCDVDE